jgi:asparagine synthase (glutamine-hydrolysing)
MCGIVGMAGKRVRKDEVMLRRMRDALTHRGPDDAGEWWSDDGTVGLGMRRLAIIDLSPSGRQPMMDGAKDFVIIFNGEIYNYKDLRHELQSKGHRFTTASDTEVILESYRAWKHDCLRHLNGMFAFALYDRRANQIFFARDRAGEKPLFYNHEGGTLWFGSELKSILASGVVRKTLNRRALNYYLTFGYVPGNLCLLDGFAKLPPAHAMSYDIEKDKLDIWRYWSLPEATAADEHPAKLSVQLEQLLEDAVRRQLVADVPVGILLSGGVDSSLITAMAARNATGKVKTFTVTFPGFGTLNEAPFARIVADHFGTQHTELEGGNVPPEVMFELARQYDEPIADSSMIPTYLISKLIRKHATVAVGGDGGDELFGGYLHYSMVLKAARMQSRLPSFIKKPFRRFVQSVPPGFPYKNKAKAFLSGNPHYEARVDPYFDNAMIEKLLGASFAAEIPDVEKMTFNAYGAVGSSSPLQAATRTDFLNYLPDDVLTKVDRASMLASLEVRAPFLDYRIIEFAFGRVPDSLKATESERKILLKLLARKILPQGLELNRKQGFSVPLGDWFSRGWEKFMKDVLFHPTQTLFKKKYVQRLFWLQEKGIFNYQRLYALTMLELWRLKYNISLP